MGLKPLEDNTLFLNELQVFNSHSVLDWGMLINIIMLNFEVRDQSKNSAILEFRLVLKEAGSYSAWLK